jgi:hydantoinase/carbamoylase family amidase
VADLLQIARAARADRITGRLEALARISAGGPGVTRLGYSTEERAAVELAAGWAREAGAEVGWGRWGNCFALVPGHDPAAPVALVGSHLDTVPSGGRYDGALGVVAALEALALAAEVGYRPRRGLELVIWACEEPIRFAQGRVGSQLFAGRLQPADLVPNEAAFDLGAWIDDRAPSARRPDRPIAGYLELHIEQARRLERAGLPIGVVAGIAGSNRLSVEVRGQADHSGATPMDLRADALCAAAELILAVEALGRAEAAHSTVATVGKIDVRPNAVNVIPGEVRLTPDVRSLDAESSRRVIEGLRRRAAEIAAERGVAIEVVLRNRTPPTVFPPEMVDLVETAARDLGLPYQQMPSGAGHDGQSLAPNVPVGMVFVPSRDGLSHAPGEHTAPEHCLAGTQVLTLAWVRLAEADRSN